MRNTIQLRYFSISALQLGIFFLWLVHVAAILGVMLGYEEWFITKTPANLAFLFILTVLLLPVRSPVAVWSMIFFFLSGMFVEWLGVNHGLLFGTYSYGANLGIKFQGVPLLIGVNWAILVMITGVIANQVSQNRWIRVFTGSALMVGLDFLMEHSAPRLDFWEFQGGIAPISNYVAWFGIACLLHAVFQLTKITGSYRFAFHMFVAQAVFFLAFFLI
jgi:putative membrane protein